MDEQGTDPRITALMRALRRAQLLRERESAALRRRLRGLRPRPPQSMPVPRSLQRPTSRSGDGDDGARRAVGG